MKARIAYVTILLSLLSTALYGQEKVRFQLSVPEETVSAGSQWRATLRAEIEEGWHLYSMTQPPGGPIPTTISVEENDVFLQAGSVEQPEPLIWFDQNFGINTEYFEGEVDFMVPVRVKPAVDSGVHDLPVSVRFMVCSDTLCLPPQTKTSTAAVRVAGSAGTSGIQSGQSSSAAALSQKTGEEAAPAEVSGASGEAPMELPGEGTIPFSTLAYIWFSMVMGALALLTPCVFPMIPITVSYFTKRDTTRRQAVGEALLYAVGIVLTFTLIGFTLTFLFGAGGINRLAASPIVNTLIALIFIVFALSLFGVIELRLPSSWLNAINRKSSSATGIVGIMLMAFTFSLTSFTCTVPFVGTVMVAALHGDVLWSLLGVTAFATVFAAPFFLLALFPSWLQSLPKSGNWMNSVKITMGFLELAAAMKFISNVDLVYQWEILTRPVFITVWLSISLMTVLYLLGKFRFPHETAMESVGAGRVLSSLFFLAISFYLLRGLFGFPLGELDAFLPPRNYGGAGAGSSVFAQEQSGETQQWRHNYQEALSVAQQQNRPIFLNFTGYTCTNCRWMEGNMFPLPEVRKLLSEFVLVELYTDGTEPQHAKNLNFEQERFGTIAVPLYAIMSSEDKILTTFPGLTRDKSEFIAFLEKGLQAHRSMTRTTAESKTPGS